MDAPKYKYTWAIIFCPETNQILLLNREKPPWMGRWNGVGGKLSCNETPLDCIKRETEEETGLVVDQFESRGAMEWVRDGQHLGGMYLFTATVTPQQVQQYSTPKKHCHEGILDWKDLGWALDPNNSGIVDNVQVVLEKLFTVGTNARFVTTYVGGKLSSIRYWPDAGSNNAIDLYQLESSDHTCFAIS